MAQNGVKAGWDVGFEAAHENYIEVFIGVSFAVDAIRHFDDKEVTST